MGRTTGSIADVFRPGLMTMSNTAPIRWLDLLAAVEPDLERDPAAMGRAIRRWATLAAAAHRAESVKTRGVETVSSLNATGAAE